MGTLAPLDQDVVRFDIYDVLAVVVKGAVCSEEMGLPGMHNVLMVQLSKATQRIFQNPFHE